MPPATLLSSPCTASRNCQRSHAEQCHQRRGWDAQTLCHDDYRDDVAEDAQSAEQEFLKPLVQLGAPEDTLQQTGEDLDNDQADQEGQQGGKNTLQRQVAQELRQRTEINVHGDTPP